MEAVLRWSSTRLHLANAGPTVSQLPSKSAAHALPGEARMRARTRRLTKHSLAQPAAGHSNNSLWEPVAA